VERIRTRVRLPAPPPCFARHASFAGFTLCRLEAVSDFASAAERERSRVILRSAAAFGRYMERYLKHGSGHAFANRHLW
jgi:hypothetical protein